MSRKNRRRYHEPSPIMPKNRICQWCNKAYARQGALDNHIKTQHPAVRGRKFRKIASGGLGKPGSSSFTDVVDLRSPSPDGDRPNTNAGPHWQTVNCESSSIRGPTVHQRNLSNSKGRGKVNTRTTARFLSSDDEDAPEGSRGLLPRVSPIRAPSPMVLSDSSDDERPDVKPFHFHQQGIVQSEYGDSDNDDDDAANVDDHWDAPNLPQVDHGVESDGGYDYDSKHESDDSDDKGGSEGDEETTNVDSDSESSTASSDNTPRRFTIPRVGTLPPPPPDTNDKSKKVKAAFVPGFGAMSKGVNLRRQSQGRVPDRKGKGVERVPDKGNSPKKIVEEEPSGISIGLHHIQLESQSPILDKGKGKAVDRPLLATPAEDATKHSTLDKGKGVDRGPLVLAAEEAVRSGIVNKGKGVDRSLLPSPGKPTSNDIVDKGKAAERTPTAHAPIARIPAEVHVKNNAPMDNTEQLLDGAPQGVKRPAPETTSTPKKKRAPPQPTGHQIRIPPTPSTSGDSAMVKGNLGAFLEHCKEAEEADVLRQQSVQRKAETTTAHGQGKTRTIDTDKPSGSNPSGAVVPVPNTPQRVPMPIRVPSDSGQSQYHTPPGGNSPATAHHPDTDAIKQRGTDDTVNVQPFTLSNQVFPPTPYSHQTDPHPSMNRPPNTHTADGCADCDSLSAAATVLVQSFVRMAHGLGHTGGH